MPPPRASREEADLMRAVVARLEALIVVLQARISEQRRVITALQARNICTRCAMRRLLRRACHAANLAREQGVTLSPRLIALIERRYDAILMEGSAFHEAQPALISTARKRRGRVPRRTGHNLPRRLHGRKPDVLRFLSDPMVPFTNNPAERDGRMMKSRQEISGGFRSGEGAGDFAVIRSMLSTARKRGWNILRALASQPGRLIAEPRDA